MISVCCAIIEQENTILATRRGEGIHLSGYWEFPGGKVEPGESDEECIIREIGEELNLDIEVLSKLQEVEYCYPGKSILLIPFVCKIYSGKILLKDHSEYRWINPENWQQLVWAPADVEVIKYYLKR